MGVPKFYRWISERCPCLSQVVQQNQIPEFDNLYLDMNGIIHTCSHPNDNDPHFRISEKDIFRDICHYIEFLFRMIQPKKVFFMAVDGVAPRAKMNQQRARRFRTAKEAEAQEKRAVERGEILPTEARFDSNCITPGTEFMSRLHEQLKYFLVTKVSTDKMWQNKRIYLSGHETPGEGEHKIMDFIRYERSQPDYNPNTRHCLYGLDADLIMLSLCTHEPHIAILREEVVFGWKHPKISRVVPEHTTFHLLHLSLMREYLDFEFSALKETLDFPYNLDSIIDDWVLMGFLVGNDFIPNLPYFHIQRDALQVLYKAYINVLPTLDGYINENGTLNLERFEKYLKYLSQYDYEKFNDTYADLKYWEGKTSKKSEREDSDKIDKKSDNGFLDVFAQLNDGIDCLSLNGNDDDSDSEELFELEFRQHKRDYYMNKLDYENVTPEVLKDQAHGYVRAIQWNLHYYYNSVVSWSWFYPHHYSPYISDIKEFQNLDLNFDKGKPFLPFQQLLSVLPAASKNLLPLPYQKLMTDPDSPLKSFYPEDFKTDLNGKNQDWEAVVLIPFINEKLLIENSVSLDESLTWEENSRNIHGPHLLYTFSENQLGSYKSPLPDVFPDVISHARCEEIDENYFRLSIDKIKKGLLDNTHLGVYFPGFPTFKHINHKAELKNEKVKVFQSVSSGENMMITVTQEYEKDIEVIGNEIVGNSVYVRWPHLVEALVIEVSNGVEKLCLSENKSAKENIIKKELTSFEKDCWKKDAQSIIANHYERFGIHTGDINIIVRAKVLTGKRCLCTSNGRVTEEKQWTNMSQNFALQLIVKDISVYCSSLKKLETVEELYPVGMPCFMLGHPYYGCMGELTDCNLEENKGRLRVIFEVPSEPYLSDIRYNEKAVFMNSYMPGYALAKKLCISSYLFSRMTGTFFVQTNSRESMNANRSNIGLNLKFNARNEEIPGYSKKMEDGTWLYSEKALEVMDNYLRKFPELFEKLIKLTDQDVIHISDLFSSEEEGREMLKKITAWLKEQPCSMVERQKCSAQMLDDAIVKAIEDAVDYQESILGTPKNLIRILVKPNILYCPSNNFGCSAPDPNVTYHLYDRVVAIQENHTVPLGLRGTIIGIREDEKLNETIYNVVFDNKFVGGLELHCSKLRGYQMKVSDLINISHGERCKPSKLESSFRFLKTIPNSYHKYQYNEAARDANKKPKYNDDISSQDRVLWNSSEQIKQKSRTFRQKSMPSYLTFSRSLPAPGQDQNNDKSQTPVFYHMNTTSPLQRLNHSPHSPFIPQEREAHEDDTQPGTSISQEFVTPIISSCPPKAFVPRNKTPELKGSSHQKQSKENIEFENFWKGLRQTQEPFPSEQPNPGHPAYSKQVSIEELFQGALTAEKKSEVSSYLRQNDNSHVFVFGSPSNENQSSAIKELYNLCIKIWGKAPSYRELTAGPMSVCQAAATLPNGTTFNSIVCPSALKAKESAAEQALAFLKAVTQNNFIQSSITPSAFHNAVTPPVMPIPDFQLGLRHLPPSSFNSPQKSQLSKPPIVTDMFVLRHLPPPPSAFIPESFVHSNRRILDNWDINDWNPPSREYFPRPEFFYAAERKLRERTEKNENKNQLKKESTDMFVPLQVQKKQSALKKTEEEPTVLQSKPLHLSPHSETVENNRNPFRETAQRRKHKSRLAVKFGNA